MTLKNRKGSRTLGLGLITYVLGLGSFFQQVLLRQSGWICKCSLQWQTA